MENIIKGKKYEQFVKDFLIESGYEAYLWNEIPLKILIDSGIYKKYKDKRIFRIDQISGKNPIIDTGCDILYQDDEWIVTQCKDHESSITMAKLAGFFYMISLLNLKGEVYYTSKISKNLYKYNHNKITYVKKNYENEKEKKVKKEKLELRDYQKDAVNKLTKMKRSILNMPCGKKRLKPFSAGNQKAFGFFIDLYR